MPDAVKAPHGQKTIALTIRFWTDGIAPKGKVAPGKAWNSGMVRFKMSETHGIEDCDWVPFDNLEAVVPAIKKAARRAGVKLLDSE
jgi:hypothetical protein